MDKKDLQKKLSQPYSTKNWQEVVQFVFPNVQIFDPVQDIPIDEKYSKIVQSFKQLGNVQLNDGKILTLLELKLYDKVNILTNRVQLNEIVSSVIDTEKANGVLSIFEKDTDDYRFSFVARSYEFNDDGDLIENKTNARRYTYVLGKNESCKTPALQFFELSKNKSTADIDAVIKAFNTTKLNKEFFDEYKEIYNDLVEFLTGKRLIKTSGKWQEVVTTKPDSQLLYIFQNNELDARNFVKILLGRLVFLKFVQKKGWLGVDKDRVDWKDGNIRFLEDAFEDFQQKDLFYSNFLSPFFDCLNAPERLNDVFVLTNSKVPFLSGGLFDENNLKTKRLNLPKKHFEKIFDFLDRYNFTIDENVDIKDGNEFSIDPEMLGHIFENLLEDNKDKGAFYTPKEIVRYMCQESLKEYLKTSLDNNKQLPADEQVAANFEQALHNFVTKKEAGGIIEFEETIARALKDVKICDPAIGSGAFPMGLLNEIFQLVHTLYEANADKVERVWGLSGWQPNVVKQNIIQNSIYGVDIEKGAVDVARLRFWLSLIVDEPEPKPLPHLNYKIVVGNSLVSKLEDTIIDIDWQAAAQTLPETDLFGKAKPKQFNAFEVDNNEKQKQLLEQISKKQKAVFDPNSDEEKLSLEIRDLKIDLLINQLDAMVKIKGIATEPKGAGKNIKTQTELWLQTLGWQKQISKLQQIKKQPKAPLNFFDWKLDFPEIMNDQVSESVGFDIVIANPPYFEISDPTLKNRFKEQFKDVLSGHYDIYIFFFQKSIELLKSRGISTFITPHTFLHYTQFKNLRKFIVEKCDIIEITDRISNIFENAVVDNSLSVLRKDKSEKNFSSFSTKRIRAGKIENQEILCLESSEFTSETFDITALKKLSELASYLNNTKRLGEIVESSQGITVYAKVQGEKINYFRNNDLEENAKRFVKGRDINKYENNWKNSYIVYGRHLWCRRDEKYFESPKIFLRQTADRIIATYIDEPFYCIDSVHSLIRRDTQFDLKFILAILNSKLGDHIFKLIISETGKVFAQVKLTFLRRIPIKNLNNQSKFITLVDKILKAKELQDDTSKFEQEIDNLVYKLYELTYDEVLVIEPEFLERITRTQYDNLKVS